MIIITFLAFIYFNSTKILLSLFWTPASEFCEFKVSIKILFFHLTVQALNSYSKLIMAWACIFRHHYSWKQNYMVPEWVWEMSRMHARCIRASAKPQDKAATRLSLTTTIFCQGKKLSVMRARHITEWPKSVKTSYSSVQVLPCSWAVSVQQTELSAHFCIIRTLLIVLFQYYFLQNCFTFSNQHYVLGVCILYYIYSACMII